MSGKPTIKQSWKLSLSSTSVSEGDSIQVTVKAKKGAIVPDLLSVHFYGPEGSGINDADFQDSRFKIRRITNKSKSYKFSFLINNDGETEGNESGEFVLFFDKAKSYSGGILSKFPVLGPVIINDTSQSPSNPLPPAPPPPSAPQPPIPPQELCWEFENNIDSLHSQTIGNDTVKSINITSENFNGFLYSNAIIGTSNNDDITGTDGNDLIIGGEGVDIVTGGGGADIFYITKESNFNQGHNYVIQDFNPGQGDVILLDAALFDNITGFRNAAGSVNNQFGRPKVDSKRRKAQNPVLADEGDYINLYIQQFEGQFDTSQPEDIPNGAVLAAIKTDILNADSIFILC